jgi:hypothetical protein
VPPSAARNGVYVPAMNRKIAAWSSLARNRFAGEFGHRLKASEILSTAISDPT